MRVLNASRMSRRSGLAILTSAVVALGFSALVAAPPAAASPPGWLDRTYGTNGWGAAGAFAVAPAAGAIDSSGRAVEIVDNHTSQQAVTRLTVDGVVDLTFGTNGATALPGSPAYGQVLVGSDGIYLLEQAGTGRTSSALAKLTPDGLLDSSFGVGGIASVAFTGFPAGALTNLVQLTDGTIIVAGANAMAAIDSSGDLDATWNAAGAVPGVLTGVGAVSGLAADGNKVVATIGGSTPQLRRWLRTGAPDGGLGSAGVAALPTAGTYDGVFTGPDGDYYLTARTGASGYRPRVVGRVLPGGTVDSSYGTAGFTRMPVQDNTLRSAQIAFHGTDAYLFSSYGVGDPDVVKLGSTGALDPAFGAGGLVELMKSDLPTGGQLPQLVGGGLQPDGRVVVLLGYVGPNGNGASIGALRLNASTIALAGSFVPLVPARLLDTRVGLGAPIGRVGAGSTVHLQVGDRGGVPELGAASVVLNLTAVLPTSSGHVTVFPTGQGRPRSSSLNFEPGQTTANVVTVALGAGGQVTMTNSSSGSTDLLADVVGYYLAGTPTVAGAFVAVPQTRLLDTRVGRGAPQAPVAKLGVVAVTVAGLGGVPHDERLVGADQRDGHGCEGCRLCDGVPVRGRAAERLHAQPCGGGDPRQPGHGDSGGRRQGRPLQRGQRDDGPGGGPGRLLHRRHRDVAGHVRRGQPGAGAGHPQRPRRGTAADPRRVGHPVLRDRLVNRAGRRCLGRPAQRHGDRRHPARVR